MTPRPLLPIVVALAGSVAVGGCTPDARSAEGVAVEAREVEGERVHLLWVRSPSMPLSDEGIPEIQEAADRLGLGLSIMSEQDLAEPAADAEVEALRAALVEAGATVHYPSLAILVDGAVAGSALVGYKRADAWEALLRDRLAAISAGPSQPAFGQVSTAHEPPTPDPVAPAPPAPDVEVLWTHTVEPSPGAFFRRIPGTSYISFDQSRIVYIRHLVTGEQFRGPGWIDFVPTPDGRLFVTPASGNGGLEFYVVAEVLERGPGGTAHTLEPFLRDGAMNDQYPSVGILEEDLQGAWTRYRILVSWFSGLAFRDYEVRWSEAGPPEVEALTEKLTACPGRDLSTPILSKDGHEVAARDESTGTTRLFRLNDDASCDDLLDFGRRTSKVGFNDDGTLVAYSSPEEASGSSGTRSVTYVLDRTDMETLEVPHSRSAGLVIPELVGADSLLIAVKEEARSGQSEFRLLCCVR